MRKQHFQFRLVNWFWLALVASFFLRRNWDTVTLVLNPAPTAKTRQLLYGAGVNSDLGVRGQLVIGDGEFSVQE